MLVEQLKIPTVLLDKPLDANALDGRLLAQVVARTCPVRLQLSGNHIEQISFFVISSPSVPLVLTLTGPPLGSLVGALPVMLAVYPLPHPSLFPVG